MWAVVAACVWVCVVATPQPLHLERDSYRRPQAAAWQKRLAASSVSSSDQQNPPEEFSDFSQHLPQLSAVNSQLMLRSPRGQRQYDVPQIGRNRCTKKVPIFSHPRAVNCSRDGSRYRNVILYTPNIPVGDLELLTALFLYEI
ncbi:uncharacterized protein LOC108906619 [Anoplophora glabripennis]|uniref:uncharacterized protein LOC108906619 n=1 Tax=Anoplophora glabripennis TaxID=217634 RepID=UPI000874BE4B|nr:uncharacterized protein LOC108906619 [Anoplophora glabripennis]